MPKDIYREDVLKLVQAGAQLVEVLPRSAYEDRHLPGAINLPLTEMDRKTVARLNRNEPVIVYCHDYQWDLSPRAAWRLEALGFTQVHNYMPGKVDWMACGLPAEGKKADIRVAGDAAERDVPTCGLCDRIGNIRARMNEDRKSCVVINQERVILGLLGEQIWKADPEEIAETVMEPGPTTLRPSLSPGRDDAVSGEVP